ncbi:MAG: GNAT family N-acetyltransferase [Crocinitomicaceae bacterium]|nr:GNAT family N-acetyltransferase [Crocinitomicaceae bacterium]
MIRPAQKGDEHAIMELIHGLALYEKAPEQVVNTAEDLGVHLFDEKICEAIVAEKDNQIVGFALYYTNYSTWKGKCLYLEDFYVLPELRGEGIGSLLFDKVVEIASNRGVKRMDWQVLEWNEPALNFYKKKQAVLDPEWINGRIFFD